MSNNNKGKSLKITISESAYEEYQVLSIRSKRNVHDVMTEVLERYADKKRDKSTSVDN